MSQRGCGSHASPSNICFDIYAWIMGRRYKDKVNGEILWALYDNINLER